MTKVYRIHPAIGVARLGDSPSDYFIGPEAPGIPPSLTRADDARPATGKYKDQQHRIKRQGARCRVYEYMYTSDSSSRGARGVPTVSHSSSTTHLSPTRLLLIALLGACTKPIDVIPAPPEVVGTLTLMGEPLLASAQIELPDVEVFLQDSSAAQAGARDTTRLDGQFRLQPPSPGTYAVCWNVVGFGSGCGAKFSVKNASVYVGTVPLRSQGAVIYGKVLTGDSRPCWLSDAFFKLDVFTGMTLLDSAGQVLRTGTRANTSGEYAFGGVPPRRRYFVRADCEKATAQIGLPVTSTVVVADLTLPNRAPRIEALTASDAGKGLTRSTAGAVIQLNAATRDPDADPVEYLWRTLDGSGAIAATNAAQQSWTLAPSPGMHSVYLMARDGKGGYAFKRLDLPVGAGNVGFSGRVIDEVTQTAVPGASVTVNGVNATTNPQGWFSLTVPPAPDPERYVLNVSHPQYALLSRIHDRAAAGNTYELIRVQTSSHDPAQIIDVADTSSSGPCGARATARQISALRDSSGQTRDQAPISQPCRHRGARVILAAGSLVDSAQNAAAGPVTLAFATLNPARRALPGDYRAVDRSNTPVEMLSFGALYAEFRDAGGKLLNLKAGSSAEIRVPISAQQLAVAKPSIAIWSYNPQTGLWVEEGQASLQNTPQGPMYVGTTTHFSTLNMDVAGSDPAQATCVRFELGASLSGWTNLVIRAYVSYAGTSLQVKETALDGLQYNAIFRIPYAPPAPPPNSLRLELRGTYGGQQVVLLNNVIATDAPRPKMTGTNLWPDYPYDECGAAVTLEADPVTLPYYGAIDASGRPAFLAGPYGAFNPPNGDQEATDYYNTIDPGNATNPTLSAWWTNHGFGADGSGGTRAAYLNHNDLGFGRDMNCKTTGGDLACYVTNYGAPDQNAANADFAENRDPLHRLATVAMEYTTSEPSDRRVRFYVYGGGDPALAGKLKFADLDGLGPKPVPHLCTVCHGGRYNTTAKNATQSRFREFDLPSFKYSGGRSWDYAPSPNTLTPAELTDFAALNEMIRNVAPGTSPIKDLIDNWYTGGFGAGTAPVKPAVPTGWNAQVNGYHNVFGKSCRTCHVARDGGVANPYITFPDASDFATTDDVVCDIPKRMPNAYVTYKNFWGDLQRVIDYRALTNRTPANCH